MPSDRARAFRRIAGAAGLAALSTGLLGLLSTVANAAGFEVELNHSRALHLSSPVATVMVGNPAIADVSVHGAQLLYVLARGYGRTDLIALDAAGKQIGRFEIDVVAPRSSAVTLMRGTEQRTYNCTPRCEPVVNPADSKEIFETAVGQAIAAQNLGSGAAKTTNE